jgi:hypothetical protein
MELAQCAGMPRWMRCWGGILGVLSEKRGDLLDARPAQEADGGITQEGHHRRFLPGMEGALVLAEGDILGAMHIILSDNWPESPSPPD